MTETVNIACPCGASMSLTAYTVLSRVARWQDDHKGHTRPAIFSKQPSVANWIAATRPAPLETP